MPMGVGAGCDFVTLAQPTPMTEVWRVSWDLLVSVIKLSHTWLAQTTAATQAHGTLFISFFYYYLIIFQDKYIKTCLWCINNKPQPPNDTPQGNNRPKWPPDVSFGPKVWVFGGLVMTTMGPNDATCIIWALGVFFLFLYFCSYHAHLAAPSYVFQPPRTTQDPQLHVLTPLATCFDPHSTRFKPFQQLVWWLGCYLVYIR
jgi:hypothetical protein